MSSHLSMCLCVGVPWTELIEVIWKCSPDSEMKGFTIWVFQFGFSSFTDCISTVLRFMPFAQINCNLQALLFFVFSITFLGAFLIQDYGELLNIPWDIVKNREVAGNMTDTTVSGSLVQRCIWWICMNLAELSMSGFGWSGVESMCQ